MTVNEWIDLWYKTYKEPYLKRSSLESIKYTVLHIRPALGILRLADVKGIHIQGLLNSLRDKPNTMTKAKVLCGDIFKSAYNNQYISFNPFLAVRVKNSPKERRKALTVSEQKSLMEFIKGKRYELLILTYLYTGARRNEVLYGLDINLKKGFVYIKGTKTARSVRAVPLFPIVREKLSGIDDYKAYYASFSPDYITHLLPRICSKIGLSGFCVHSLRNTFATRCLEAGVGVKTIQTWLGHSELSTTMDIYIDKAIYSDKNNFLLAEEINKFVSYFE